MVFFSPRSGHQLPPPGIPSVMRYIVSLNPYSINGFGRVRTVPTNVPGGLGYTYPNPIPAAGQAVAVLARRRLEPDVLVDGGRLQMGARARVRLLRPRAAAIRQVRRRRQLADPLQLHRRPSGELEEQPALRALRGRGPYAMSGRKLGTLSDVPLHTSKLDHIYNYSARGGRAWGHDIALTAEGRPRVIYTPRVANRDTFYYAYHNGT
jgi:hypothetical protein